jgi:alpha-glucosidase
MKAFTAGNKRLNSANGFDFLYADRHTPELVKRVADQWPEGEGWPTWAFENHDAPRAVSRWVAEEHRDRFARTKMLLLCSLRGSITIWQGEELGLPQVDVPFDRLQDPEAIANWPHTLSRDGARTPMPWDSGAANLGFSTTEPWLPVGESHAAMAVDRQQSRGSMLDFTRSCLKLRRENDAIRLGSMRVLDADEQRLVFERTHGNQRLRCTFNLSGQPIAFEPQGAPRLTAGEVGSSLGAYSGIVETIA